MDYQGVIIANDKDRLAYFYIVKCRGEQSIPYAISQLAGNRKPYISNIAKILQIDIPDNLSDPEKILPIEEGLKMFEGIIRLKK